MYTARKFFKNGSSEQMTTESKEEALKFLTPNNEILESILLEDGMEIESKEHQSANINNQVEEAAKSLSATIKIIREALKKRTGLQWSVARGKGTANGWITIQSPPKRREQFYYNSKEDREILAKTLGLESVHQQGELIPASYDYRCIYIARALTGSNCGFTAERYWD